jgi:hypothetical protein
MGFISQGIRYGTKAALGLGKATAVGTGKAAVDLIRSPYDALRYGARAVRGKDFKGNKLSAKDRLKAVGGMGMAGLSAAYIPEVIPVTQSSQPAYEQAMRRMQEGAIK